MEQLEVNKESKIGDPDNTSLVRGLTSDQKICFPVVQRQSIHYEWIQSKTGGIEVNDVIFIMSEHKPRSLILPMLRKHQIILMWICGLAEMLWLYGWILLGSKL